MSDSEILWTGACEALQSVRFSRQEYWENSMETCILSIVKQITSPGWMHETSARAWCTGKTQRNRVEWVVGGGDRDGEYM